MSTIKPPRAFFDTLEEMPNPFKQPVIALEHLLDEYSDDAVQDYQYASEFIYSYRGSPDTFATYRREIEHFLHWCWIIVNKSLNQIVREDIETYLEFSKQPPATWVGPKNVARFQARQGERLPNEEWRPYVCTGKEYVISQAAIQSLFSVLSSFFNFLIQENYLAANPVSQIRQKSKFIRKKQLQSKVRRLSPLQWDYVIETAEKLATERPQVHERTLFILNALFAMYLRISELVETPRWAPQMGHFQSDQEGNWWFITVGKGNKEREISVSDAMLDALKRYRASRGLSALPSPGESTPLIHKTRGKGGITSTRQIRCIVQTCFDTASANMRKEGFVEEADRLASATVHWLRHTGISEDVKHRPREHVRDDAGHGSSAITDRYIDVERAERHASARNKQIKS
ncbi:MAG: site-specific integrase [Gammaproteobacteria bacterium]|jgi:site-specific recombinase XerD|nr:site-specific integrase [Gammaproteobacteria bacterium]MDP7455070.1 site-specific integrase [Gammaproteobacteria bacterium]HJO12979.1 site-specific integrase [Gammaproteobacteria bacterium]|tara:strand:+ start:448 stop:1653 length:1206 start_codon:yes stop_codon:yes gene_type:complete